MSQATAIAGVDVYGAIYDTRAASRALYTTAFLGQWGWRTWEFAVALILIELYPDTLLLVALYGLLDALVKLVTGSAIGSYIDRTERWPAATLMYLLQNGCIAASAVTAALLIWLGGPSMDSKVGCFESCA
jgi:hypothetical protein